MVDTFRVNRQEVNHILHLYPTPHPLQPSWLLGPIVIMLPGIPSDCFEMNSRIRGEGGWAAWSTLVLTA